MPQHCPHASVSVWIARRLSVWVSDPAEKGVFPFVSVPPAELSALRWPEENHPLMILSAVIEILGTLASLSRDSLS